ncbi:acyl dehydratase [Micromonospora sp. NPDC020750]|uniref:acyl dehydratase n=1 Tax=unclassified Micromonospora TaxID=2617518 RepID=UPI003788AF51
MTTRTRLLDEVSVGDELPELQIPVTRTVIVAGALATRDFEDVHHDPQRAVERGTPDTYMSINNTNGLVGRYVTDWSGPGAVLTRLSTRLGVPNFSGGTLVLTGQVKAKQADTVTVAVTGTNSKGVHTTSEVTLRLPTGESRQQPEVAQ